MKMHGFFRSGTSHRLRIALNLKGLDYEQVSVSLAKNQHHEDVFKALRLHQYARIDIMMNEKGEMFALEANTLPGMTPTSLLPQEALAVGINYNELCEKLINMAMEK